MVSIHTENKIGRQFQNYYHIGIEEETGNNIATDNIENIMSIDTMTGALLLPKLFEEGYEQKDCNTLYCIIQSRWM